MCLICVAGCDLYLAPQVTDNLTGVVVEYEYLVLRISHPGQVRVDSFVVAAFSGQHVQNLLVRRGIAYIAGIVIGVIIGSDKIDKLMGQLYVFRVGRELPWNRTTGWFRSPAGSSPCSHFPP